MEQSAAAVVVAGTVTARDSAIGFLVAREMKGEGVRVLFGPAAALAFGAGFGLAVAALGWLRRR
jgi:hypothetical protein